MKKKNKTSLTCPKCGGDNITSRDDRTLRGWIFARLPYQCINCRHCFYGKDSFFSQPTRVLFWTLVIFSVLLITWLFSGNHRQTMFGSNVENMDTVTKETIVQSDNDTVKTDEFIPETEAVNSSMDDEQETVTDQQLKSDNNIAQPVTSSDTETTQQVNPEIPETKSEANTTQDSRFEELSDSERTSLIKVSVNHTVDQWRTAWESGDAERYLSFYSEQFKPTNDIPLNDWRKQRLNRVTPEKQIHLLLSNFEFESLDQGNGAKVVFDQLYRAKGISDQSRKELLLTLEKGQWRIISEHEL